MQFGDLKFERTERNLRRVAAMMQETIKSQAPIRTGRLERSIEVDVVQDDNGEWDILIYYSNYGNYTNFGTRPYFERNQLDKNLFGMSRFRGYEKGKGGIRPQYWLSLRGQEQRFQGPIEQGLETDMLTFMDNAIKNLQNLK
jgi:hypothetical protein